MTMYMQRLPFSIPSLGGLFHDIQFTNTREKYSIFYIEKNVEWLR